MRGTRPEASPELPTHLPLGVGAPGHREGVGEGEKPQELKAQPGRTHNTLYPHRGAARSASSGAKYSARDNGLAPVLPTDSAFHLGRTSEYPVIDFLFHLGPLPNRPSPLCCEGETHAPAEIVLCLSHCLSSTLLVNGILSANGLVSIKVPSFYTVLWFSKMFTFGKTERHMGALCVLFLPFS